MIYPNRAFVAIAIIAILAFTYLYVYIRIGKTSFSKYREDGDEWGGNDPVWNCKLQ